jgi:hypothetical protein
MFDEQPDGDPHGECVAEIRKLQGLLAEAMDGDPGAYVLGADWHERAREAIGTNGVAACDPVPSRESAVKLPLHQAAQWNAAVACAECEPHKLVAVEGRTLLAAHEALTRGMAAVHEPKGNRCGCSHWTKKTCPANNCPWQGKRPVDAHGVGGNDGR